MKILVTGGTGFLGRHLVWRLATLGHEVIFTGRQADAAKDVLARCPSWGQVHWQLIEHGKPRASQTLCDVSSGVDAVVHAAALSAPWGQWDDFIKANVNSTQEVINACKNNGIRRLVHISTPSVYFEFKDKIAVKEDALLPRPTNFYVATKTQAERLVCEAGLDECVILRPKAIFGPWDKTLMPRILRVIKSGPVPLIRGGDALLDITYVDNVVDAICLSLTKPLPRPLVKYNVSNGEPLAIADIFWQLSTAFKLPLRTKKLPWFLVKATAQLMECWSKTTNGKEPVVTTYGAGVLAFSQTLDISAIKSDLGYRPKVSIADALKLYSEWYFQHEKQT